LLRTTGDFSVVEKFLDDSERLYGEPHPSRCCVRSARRIVVKARQFWQPRIPWHSHRPASQQDLHAQIL
jgi:hypothetical protein